MPSECSGMISFKYLKADGETGVYFAINLKAVYFLCVNNGSKDGGQNKVQCVCYVYIGVRFPNFHLATNTMIWNSSQSEAEWVYWMSVLCSQSEAEWVYYVVKEAEWVCYEVISQVITQSANKPQF